VPALQSDYQLVDAACKEAQLGQLAEVWSVYWILQMVPRHQHQVVIDPAVPNTLVAQTAQQLTLKMMATKDIMVGSPAWMPRRRGSKHVLIDDCCVQGELHDMLLWRLPYRQLR
jgi:hypothetical protein